MSKFLRPMILKPHFDKHATPTDADRQAVDMELAKQMAEILQSRAFYPGHRWATFADSKQGIVWISIPALMGPSTVYVIHADKLTSYPEMCKELREAAGHILERFKMPRAEFELSSFEAAKKKRIRDHVTPMPE